MYREGSSAWVLWTQAVGQAGHDSVAYTLALGAS